MKRWLLVTLALLIPMMLFTAGLTHGRPRDEYSPSTVKNAWLNSQTVYHPDAFAYVGKPYRMLLTREWNPHYYHNPPLNIYTNLALFWASGAENMPHNVQYGEREIAPFQLYIMARYMSALYMLLTVVFTYAAGRIVFDRRAGLLAAALTGLSPLVVQHAHYATPNAETTMLATAALLLAFIILKQRVSPRLPLWSVYLIAGLLVGLTMATRYNAVVVGMVTGLAMLTDWWRHRQWAPLVVGLLVMPVGFAIGTPGIILATQEVIDWITDIVQKYAEVGGGDGFTTASQGLSGFYYHWRYAALVAVGPGAVVAALVGLGITFQRQTRRIDWRTTWAGVVLVLYMLVYTGLALRGKRIQANLLFPLIAPLALLAGYGITRLWQQTGLARRLAVGLAVLALAWPGALSARLAVLLATPDNRIDAQEWIYEHVPRGASVYLLGAYNVPVDPLDYRISQTYKGGAGPGNVRQSDVQIIVYSDAAPFLILRDRTLSSDAAITREEQIQRVLANNWIELAHFERKYWPGQNLPPDDVSYWHQFAITIYCNPADCPVALPGDD
ncbi:MAG: glycosyltransferase family 39 protein [Anaerolineae bacterium]|nr:glycosyltransferase family 39 protein [Anaerolineae bacterium]